MAKLCAILLFSGVAQALWPIPAYYHHGNSTVWLSSGVTLEFASKGYGSGNSESEKQISAAWERTKHILLTEKFVPWKFHKRGVPFEPTAGTELATTITKVIVTQTEDDPSSTPDYGEVDESYNLSIPINHSSSSGKEAGAVYISAASSYGVLHGFTTLTQLFYSSRKNGGAVYSKLAPVDIRDKPLFPHRGLNLDVSRQWYPKEDILRTIDALSWAKMNRLHLHATDSQSWTLEIPSLPGLAAKGSYADGLTYTPQDLQEILDAAKARGIEVIVEIDMPGHTTSIAESYPNLIVGRNIQPDWNTYAAQPPSGSLKLNNNAVEDFLTKLFADLLPRLRDHTMYFHTGGDEVNKNIYNLDEGVKSNDSAVLKPALQKFINHVHSEVKKNKMTPVVWEEMALDWDLDLDKHAIVQTWLSEDSTKKVVEKGHRVIAGNYNFWYLDCGNGQWLDFGPDAFAKYYPFVDYCAPKKNWRLIYSYDPTAGLTSDEAKLVLGGEVHIWSEQIDGANLDSTLWPRGAAAAEVLWSGRRDEHGVNRTFADASPRLAEFRERLVLRGVTASPIQQLWCHQNEGECELNN